MKLFHDSILAGSTVRGRPDFFEIWNQYSYWDGAANVVAEIDSCFEVFEVNNLKMEKSCQTNSGGPPTHFRAGFEREKWRIAFDIVRVRVQH